MFNTHPGYGTHKKILGRALTLTDKPVLECGCGDHSTPLIHSLCEKDQRPILTCDHDPQWLGKFKDLFNDWHQPYVVPRCINGWPDWNMLPYSAEHWGVVLVDQSPSAARLVTIAAVANNADYIVVHDTDNPNYYYDFLFDSFKYRYDFDCVCPATTVVSNFKPFEPEAT